MVSGLLSIVRCQWCGGRSDSDFFVVMKVSPDAVAMPGRKGWKNRRLACGIETRLLPALFNFRSGHFYHGKHGDTEAAFIRESFFIEREK